MTRFHTHWQLDEKPFRNSRDMCWLLA